MIVRVVPPGRDTFLAARPRLSDRERYALTYESDRLLEARMERQTAAAEVQKTKPYPAVQSTMQAVGVISQAGSLRRNPISVV
jgi:hypothetical protein